MSVADLSIEHLGLARLGGLKEVVIEDSKDVVADVLELLFDLDAVLW